MLCLSGQGGNVRYVDMSAGWPNSNPHWELWVNRAARK